MYDKQSCFMEFKLRTNIHMFKLLKVTILVKSLKSEITIYDKQSCFMEFKLRTNIHMFKLLKDYKKSHALIRIDHTLNKKGSPNFVKTYLIL